VTITLLELKELLIYDFETGVFYRKKKTNPNIVIGEVAGNLDGHGYIRICVKSKPYAAHRLAWLYTTGRFPKNDIDHINGVRNDNRFYNLREVTRRENQCNRKLHRDGRLPGCCYKKNVKKWQASITINSKIKHLGNFSSEETAHHTYLIWKHNLVL
jgi:hypothetical protein